MEQNHHFFDQVLQKTKMVISAGFKLNIYSSLPKIMLVELVIACLVVWWSKISLCHNQALKIGIYNFLA